MESLKLACITGATSGLGLELALQLSDRNVPLLLSGRQLDRIPPLPHATKLYCDLAQDRTPLIEAIQTHVPDLLINNAGFTVYGEALDLPLQTNLEIFEVNATATIELTLIAAGALRKAKKRGVILNVSSAAGELSCPLMAAYAASKAAVTSFSRSLDAELKEEGIRVLVAIPGKIQTPFAKRASENRAKEETSGSIPVEEAAWQMLEQIRLLKGERVIPSSHRLLLWLARALPRSISERVIRNALAPLL